MDSSWNVVFKRIRDQTGLVITPSEEYEPHQRICPYNHRTFPKEHRWYSTNSRIAWIYAGRPGVWYLKLPKAEKKIEKEVFFPDVNTIVRIQYENRVVVRCRVMTMFRQTEPVVGRMISKVTATCQLAPEDVQII